VGQVDAADSLLAAIQGLGSAPLCGRLDRVRELGRARKALDGRYLRELGILDLAGEHEDEAAITAASWLRRELGLTEREATRDVALARRLRALPVLGDAMVAGEVSYSTAEVVARAASMLPEELVRDTEPALVEAARLLPPADLRRFLAEKVAALAPEALQDQVESAYERRKVFISPLADMHDLRGSLEPLLGERLEIVLNAIMERDRVDGDVRTRAQQRHDALDTLLDIAGEAEGMPQVRECLPHLVIVKEEDAPAHSTGGTVLTDGQLDLVSCAAVVTEVVVAPGRRPLDVGRSSRSLSRRLWLAVVVRDDGHCQVAGCDRPANRCVPHHIVPWRLGGPTDMDNLVLLCVQHHHALHDRKINLILYDGRRLTPTGSLPVGAGPPPYVLIA
jgi:hypothetical protein